MKINLDRIIFDKVPKWFYLLNEKFPGVKVRGVSSFDPYIYVYETDIEGEDITIDSPEGFIQLTGSENED